MCKIGIRNVAFYLMVLFMLVFGAGVMWAGGQQEDSGAQAGEQQQEQAEASGEPVTVVLAMSGNPDTLDPHTTSGTLTFQTVNSFYDTLVEPNRDGKLVPALAESWEVSEDKLTWIFRLRKGVTFHDGTPFTSADVKATFERIVDPEIASPKATEFVAIENITTPDEYTVVFELSEPYAPLLASMASGWGAILPKKLIESGHDFGSNPVGTGPFTMKEWIRDNKVVLEKNEDYWMDGVPKVDFVELQVIPEQAVQVQGLLSGQVDIIYTVGETDIPMIKDNASTKLEQSMSSLAMVMGINCEREYLDKAKLRQALNFAIDRQTVLDIAYGGGVPIATFMDVEDPYYVDLTDKYYFDPAKAKRMIQEVGLPSDAVFEMALPQNYAPHVKAGELYQEMLSNVGLNVEIKLVDWSTWLSDVYKGGQYDFTVIGHTGKLDPDGRLAGYGTKETYVNWENERVAQLIEQARKVVDFKKRKELYTEALTIISEEAPFVFVGTSYRYIGRQNDVHGFYLKPKVDTFEFRYVEKQ
ncbi:MAG: hypothetical protein K9L68_07205 [Spirochaetales bacterium]|nr:hypothetical protein [Spirochaetales bacterium]MCF7938371.1 hypothetical protein [Spirochaetales bacterium]